ncbi:peptide MFS transporter [Kordiimonas marina]|uniref:peptide MFS transporter n=1 Tax=Kordiimonas marina TaxID=2872312 RepID=UPI001FF1E515|nr:oligopeptide:H+ symporter [Kordiimonas marina]MCJ9428523.1 oligopeptide:H+ symporter [Kordiimonas marina]
MTDTVDKTGSQERELLGHPIGLGVLFMTEMWERFAYYGMRAILILYLTKHFLFGASEASLIYGGYTGLVYLLPILGGYMADRYLGSRKAVVYGGLLLSIGQLLLAVTGAPAEDVNGHIVRDGFYLNLFFLALALNIVGVGFLKANISTIVGQLYGPKDARRDGGFTIFYMGINLGSLFATMLVGYAGEAWGWNYGFAIAGIGMLLGLVIFLVGQPLLEGRADPPSEALKEKVAGFLTKEYLIYFVGLVLVAVMWKVVQYQNVVGQSLTFIGLAMLVVIIGYGFMRGGKVGRERLLVACVLIFVQPFFWALFEQQGSSLTLLADQQFDLDVFGFHFFASQVQTMNPVFIVVFAPVFAWFWSALSRRGWEPSTPAKFALGMLIVGLGYVALAFGLGLQDGPNRSFFWMVVIYLAMTWGELCLSPVGLSMVTKLAMPEIVGLVMGTWFLFTSLGNWAAGKISSLIGTDGPHSMADKLDVPATMHMYNSIGLFAIGVGVFLLVITPILKKGMHGVH